MDEKEFSRPKKDRAGEVVGEWTILRPGQAHVFPSGKRATKWLCRCSCGVEREVLQITLGRGSFSCGHDKRQKNKRSNRISSAAGSRSGRLVVLGAAPPILSKSGKSKLYRLECLCDCGKKVAVYKDNFRSGRHTSCGCSTLRGTGTTRTSNGYVKVWKPDHPAANQNGYIAEHIWVMMQKLGRNLLPGENVHHINGVRDDNRPENLELWSTVQPSGQRVADRVEWATELLRLYAPNRLEKEYRNDKSPEPL